MAEFKIITGTSQNFPEEAARNAEHAAHHLTSAGWEQIGIAADVLPGVGAGPAQSAIADKLDNLAQNIYQLVGCTCPVGDEGNPGAPPPPAGPGSGGGGAAPLWVVYILLRR